MKPSKLYWHLFGVKIIKPYWLLRIYWWLRKNRYPIIFRGTPEQLRDELLGRKWYEHTWYILEDTRFDRK